MPSVKTMKGLPIFLALLLGAGAARAEKLKERFDKTLPLKEGAKVELENVSGVVTFEAWDRAEVRVEAEKWAESKRSDVAKKALAEVRIQVTQTPGGVKIQTKMPEENGGVMDWLLGKEVSVGANYRVFVPRQAVVAANNVNGEITLRGTRGGGSLQTINGQIKLAGLEGGIKATTVNGAINAELSDISDDLWLETVNGAVSLRLPAGSRMTLDASMVHGVVQSDFAVEGPGGAKKRNVLRGDVNGGGNKVVIRNVNGVIQISES